ncbi:MAG: ABC transporter permease subunit [Mesorhizobium sp.]
MSYLDLISFGPGGWANLLLAATAVTLSVALGGFLLGSVIGTFVAWARLSRNAKIRFVGSSYTTVFRGVPDLLVIYLLYFGGSAALTAIGKALGAGGFVGMPTYLTGVLAIGILSAAYQAEVFRGAFLALAPGEVEAGKAVGMSGFLLFRRIIAPQVLRYALPGLGNTWQLALKETALISVVGLVELVRQAQIAAGSTRRPFEFFITAAALYLCITFFSSLLFRRAEQHSARKMGAAL